MERVERCRWEDLLRRAEAGDAQAQWEVGSYFEYGAVDEAGATLVESDPPVALRWYRLSAAQGSESGQCALSNLLSSGDGIRRDFAEALYWGEQAAARGSSSATFNLGTIYRDMQQPERALEWYERAAAMGDGDALLSIALCRLFGFGTAQDPDGAYDCLNRIVTEPLPAATPRTRENARYWLGLLHLLGAGRVEKSVNRARAWLESADHDDDHEQANELLNLIGKSKYLA